jgi:methionine sulfoxide reductase heme-binding subunit
MAQVSLILAQVDPNASPFFWYVTRTMAVGAYIVLTASVIVGMLRSIARVSGERVSWLVEETHSFLAVLAGVLIAGHLLTLMVDPYLPFSLSNIIIPGDQPYKPLAVNLGVFALYTMLALLLSSWARQRISHGLWRSIHYLSFIAYILVTAHGWLAGSDMSTDWMPALYVGSIAAVAVLAFIRFISSGNVVPQSSQPGNKVAVSAIVALIIAVVGIIWVIQIEDHLFSGPQSGVDSSLFIQTHL